MIPELFINVHMIHLTRTYFFCTRQNGFLFLYSIAPCCMVLHLNKNIQIMKISGKNTSVLDRLDFKLPILSSLNYHITIYK